MMNKFITFFSFMLWNCCVFAAEISDTVEPQFMDVQVLAKTERLVICEFFPQVEQQLLRMSKDEISPYLIVEKMDEDEIITELTIRKKLREQYSLEECFMNGNARLPLLDHNYHVIGLYTFLFPDNKNYCEAVFYLLPQYRGRGYMPEAIVKINELLLKYTEKPTYWPELRPSADYEEIRQLSESQFYDQFDTFYQFQAKKIEGMYAEVALSNKSSLIANLKANMIPSKSKHSDAWWGEVYFYFPVKEQDPLLTEVVRRIAYSSCSEEEENSLNIARQQIRAFSFISPEIADQAISFLELESSKKTVSFLAEVPLSPFVIYRIILKF